MLTISPLTAADVGEIYELEKSCFCSEAWSRADFEYLASGSNGVFAAFAARFDGVLCGYICTCCVAGEMEISSVAVSPEYRRRGVARALISAADEHFHPEKTFLEVRSSNAPAQALYKSLGFKPYAVRADYYDDPPEDAVLMMR